MKINISVFNTEVNMRYTNLFTLIIFYDFDHFGIIINFVSSDFRHNPVLFMKSKTNSRS